MSQTELDKLVGNEPEDVTRKVAPHTGKDSAEETSHGGGESKLPKPPVPFKLGG